MDTDKIRQALADLPTPEQFAEDLRYLNETMTPHQRIGMVTEFSRYDIEETIKLMGKFFVYIWGWHYTQIIPMFLYTFVKRPIRIFLQQMTFPHRMYQMGRQHKNLSKWQGIVFAVRYGVFGYAYLCFIRMFTDEATILPLQDKNGVYL